MENKYSLYLKRVKPTLKLLLNDLIQVFPYVTILASDTKGKTYNVSTRTTVITDSFVSGRGFVVRVYDHANYCEYSFNNIDETNYSKVLLDIVKQTKLKDAFSQNINVEFVDYPLLEEEYLTKTFFRDTVKSHMNDEQIVNELAKIKDSMHEITPMLVNAVVQVETCEVSKLYLSNNKDLEQYYNYAIGVCVAATSSDKGIKAEFNSFSGTSLSEIFKKLQQKSKEAVEISVKLHDAKTVEPGTYDVICAPEVTGLIAHEAFGHGVEMDMFVKNRAKAIDYMNKPVASKLVNMYDGAAVFEEVSSYFFDDEGTLAQCTQIIKDGILINGINDSLTAMRLGVNRTGNGKRESYERKAYTRMTNTYFDRGNDKLEDMIKSIEKGYLLCGVNSGMEDPKNWGIQCIAGYGYEIIDGELTGNLISPVVITGYVPDLLSSISAISGDVEVCGSGFCGKGHKEFVKVSEGGPYLKAKVRLG